MLQRQSVRQFIKFGIVGFGSFLIDWCIYFTLTRAFSVFYLNAKIVSFCVAAGNSYVWNRRWTFRSREPNHLRQLTQFFLVASIGAALNAGIMYLLHGLLLMPDLLALIVATGIVMFWNFLANRYWTFRRTYG